MTFPGSTELADACRAAGMTVEDLRTTSGWPTVICAGILDGTSPIPSPICGEAVYIAKRLGIEASRIWSWVELDRTVRLGPKKKPTGGDR